MDIALDVGCFITVAAHAPGEHPETIEIPRRAAVPGGGPQPDRLLQVAILHLSDRKVTDDPVAFRLLDIEFASGTAVQFELTRYMEDHWVPVIEKDVDGSNSLPLTLDRDNPNLGRYSACRRVARTIYLGSAPLQKAANRGIDDRRVKLGLVFDGLRSIDEGLKPGEKVIVNGLQRVRPGGEVKVEVEDMKSQPKAGGEAKPAVVKPEQGKAAPAK